MKKSLLILTLSVACLVGCSRSDTERSIATKESFSNPQFVGEIKGKKLYCVQVARSYPEYDHYIYFFDNDPTVTINRMETQGKVTVQKVEVLVDGKPITINVENKQ